VNRRIRCSIPDNSGFALVGDADGGNVGGFGVGFRQSFAGAIQLRIPDVFGVVFDPTGLRKDLRKFLLGYANDAAGVVEQNGTRRSRALIQG
jgi:hypothetical protein